MVIKDKKIQQIYCYFTENTFGDFQKLILKTSKKKKKTISQQTYLYIQVIDILKFYAVLFCTYCKGLFCL